MYAKQPPPMSNNLFPPSPQGNPTNVAATQALHQLMQHQLKAANTLNAPPIPIPQTSPLSPVPPLDPHLLFQHQAAVAANKQLRLSPLPAGKNFVAISEKSFEEKFLHFEISCTHSNEKDFQWVRLFCHRIIIL